MHMEIRGAEKLSFRERQVVVLRESGKPADTVAKILKISTATVNTLFNRAKTKGYEIVIIVPGQEWGVGQFAEDSEE